MNTILKQFFPLLLLSMLMVVPSGCDQGNEVTDEPDNLVSLDDANVPVEWMRLFLDMDRYTREFRPGPASRALAYMNLAAYESVMKGMPEYKSLKDLYSGLTLPDMGNQDYHFPTVVNAVYANLFKRILPGEYLIPEYQSTLQFEILALEDQFNELFKSQVGAVIFNRSKDHGEAVANSVWEWSKTDPFGHEAHINARPDGYTPPTGPGLWQPTAPDFEDALYPYWGNVRTFSITQTEKLASEPMDFSEATTSSFYVQALEVRNTVNNLDFNGQWQAEYWNDDPVEVTFSPVSRWISITAQVLENDECHLETALYAFAKVSLALNDAGVACWHSKYTYDVERPVTYINRVIDQDWQPYLADTPSFPAYPSSHATFGAAAAEVLSHVFGYAYALEDKSHDGRTEFLGMPRSFNTFYEMAEESALSRIAAGVHFRMDADEGLDLGFKVGRKINEMPFK